MPACTSDRLRINRSPGARPAAGRDGPISPTATPLLAPAPSNTGAHGHGSTRTRAHTDMHTHEHRCTWTPMYLGALTDRDTPPMSIPCTQQSPWVGTAPPAPTLDGAGGQASPAVAVGQLGPLVGERGGAPPAVASQQDAAPLYQLPLGPALRGGRLLCRERDTVTARATWGHPGHPGGGHGSRGAHLAQ